MSDYPVLDQLKTVNEVIPDPPRRPSVREVDETEALLGLKFPPSYRYYLLTWAHVTAGNYELCWVYQDGSRLDLVTVSREAWEYFGLPGHLLPFLVDGETYYCFDTSAPNPEYPVVRWSGTVETMWPDFVKWVEEDWLPTARPLQARSRREEPARSPRKDPGQPEMPPEPSETSAPAPSGESAEVPDGEHAPLSRGESGPTTAEPEELAPQGQE